MINLKRYSGYLLFGMAGILLGFIVVFLLSSQAGLRFYTLIMLFISIAGFLLLGLIIRILSGSEDHTMLRSFVFITLLQVVAAKLFDQPLWIILDLFAIGYAIAVGIGRIGCHSVGCCHGKPVSKGILYTKKYTVKGLSGSYTGIALFPVQLTESAGLLILSVFSIHVSLHYTPGNAFLVFLYGYGCLRFVLEFYRGDKDRPYLFSFSEAQWTIFLYSIAMSSLLYISDHNLFSFWMLIYTGTLFVIVLVWGIMGKINPGLRFNEPWHIEQLLSINPQDRNSSITVYKTRLGLLVSASYIDTTSALYTFSLKNSTLKTRSLHKILKIYHLKYSNQEIIHHSSEKIQVIFLQS